ncbi:gephyrin-like molybdotransferase Glp [Ramlibacter sp.]|uniref:molybdopterin molybdotransferase MoeA n=1 Tax=Ramlibacter sp. TaxID=1917967 RepID=UPI00179C207C|nr:gephyrin-like molybdotransferase Glp [Ramlibacter sp.]MBA2674471.1 molybdopterin molybdotransferase MoeA [Ramlibacter sp.]
MKSIADIAAELQGYDPQALSADAVGDFLARLVAPVAESEEVRILDALGRVLAEDIVSPISVPPHDNSAMDGYAFDGAQLGANAPLELEVVGTALAGKAWQGHCGAGQCVKIMTGAIMPAALDTVVPQEFASVRVDPSPVRPEPVSPVRPEPVEGPASTGSARTATKTVITIPPGILRAGDNRRHKGEDLAEGKPALDKGERLGPAACGLVASLGLATVRVVRRLRVAYFSTGDEILSLGEPPREGAVYDSNRYTVHGLLVRLGCEVIDLGVVRDEPSHLEAAFRHAAARADAIITSGGVSVGEADFTKAMMKQLGDVAFWKVAMRPGRPMAVGRISSASSGHAGAVLFGLPGNPVAVMVTFLAFVRPALLRMMGARDTSAPLLKARSAQAMRKKPGRTEYQRGIVTAQADGVLQVRTTGNQGSGVLSSMVQANGLIVLHHGQGDVAPGDEVDVMMFEGAI